MAFYDPSFEARRSQVIGGNTPAAAAASPGYVDSAFEARRAQVLATPAKQQTTVQMPTTVTQPKITTSVLDAGKTFFTNTFSAISNAVSNATKLFITQPVISPVPEIKTAEIKTTPVKQENTIIKNVFDYLSTSLFPMSEARIQKEKNWLVQNYNSPVTKGLVFLQQQIEDDFKKRPETFGFTKGITQLAIGGTKSFSDYYNQETLLPKDTLGKARMAIGSIAESLATMYVGGQGLQAINATKQLLPIMFATIGQLTADEKTTIMQRIEMLPKDLLTGWLFTKIPGSDKLLSWKTVVGAGEAGGINYASEVVSKLIAGLDPKTAAKTSYSAFIIGSLFHVANVATAQLTNAKFAQKEQILTPSEMVGQAMKVSDPKAQAEFNKIALAAQEHGMNVKISVTTVQESPAAKVLGKGIVEQVTGKPQEIKLTNGDGTPYYVKVEFVNPNAEISGTQQTKPENAIVPKQIDEVQAKLDKAISTYISDEGVYKKPDGTMEQTPALKELTTIANTPEAQQIAQNKLQDAIKTGEIKKNEDGTITVYRVGTTRDDRLMSVSYDKQAAESFAEQKSVTGTARSVNEITVNPDAVKVFIGGTEKELLVQMAKSKQLYDYQSTQLDLPTAEATKIQDIAKAIPDDKLYKDPEGKTPTVETDTHVTVLYGLDTGITKKQVEDVVGTPGPITLTLGKTSVFENVDKPYDVLKVDVTSPELSALNKKIFDTLGAPGATFKDYKPHITVAYLNKGEGKAYAGNTSVEGQKITLNDLTFSSVDGKKQIIPLASKQEVQPQAGGENKPAEVNVEPPIKMELTKEAENAANTVLEALASGDPEGAQDLYNTFVNDDHLELPPFDELKTQIEYEQKKMLQGVTNELKQEVSSNPDDPSVVLLGIADKIMKHFNSPGALWKITGKKRTYQTPQGEFHVGGDVKSAFDNLVFATDLEGFKWNVRALHYKFDRVFTQLRDIMDKGDVDGADYEQFKNKIAEYLSKRPSYRAGRGATGENRIDRTQQQGEKPSKPDVGTSQVNATYGFNPKNLEDPQSDAAVKEADKLIKRSDIAKELSEKLGVPIRRGKFRLPGAIGIYKHAPKVVRIKSGGLQTIFHEVGHFLDDQFKFSQDINKTEREALMKEYGFSYEGNVKRQQAEAFAEFLRFRMTGQLSKVTNMAPEFYKLFEERIATIPEVKSVIDTATEDFKRWNEQPATAKILSHISIGPQQKESLSARIKSGLHEVYTAALDDIHPLSEFSRIAHEKLGTIAAENDPYILARNLRGWTGKAELFLNKGTFDRQFWTTDEKGRAKMNYTGPSYSEIMKPLNTDKKLDDFRVYIVAKRALELDERGIKTGIAKSDAEEAVKELEAKYSDFDEIAQKRLAYKDSLLKYAAAPTSGVLGPKGYKRIKELNKFHVPFYRVMEETSGGGFMGKRKFAGNLSSPIKKIKGSEREIIDPMESDIKDTYAIINAVERNSIGIAMANLASQNFELGRLFEEVQSPMKGIKVNAKEVLDKVMKEAGEDGIDVPEELADLTVTIFRPTQNRGQNMLNVNFGDKQKVFQVDPQLFKAIQGLTIEDAGIVMRILSMPSKLLRAGATLTPDFSLRNPIRDQFSAFIYSNYGYIPGFDLIRGVFEAYKKGDIYDQWKASGGEHAMLVSMDRDYLQKTFKDLIKGKGNAIGYFTKEYLIHPVKILQILSEFGEEATRLGEMKRAIEHKATPIAAGFASREITLDFARIGAKTRAVNLLVTFWNANVQGSDKLVRSFRSNPFRTLFRIMMGITLPSILLYFANRKDPRWREIPAWQKDLFWIVMTKKHIFRIPKPFEVGVLFGSVPERILEYIDTKDPKMFDQLMSDIANGASPGFIPTTLLPIIENISNYSFFLDRPIVPSGKEGLPAEAQYGTYTSEIAKLIGKVLHYSPSKIDNLVQGYAGGLGNYATQIIDKALIGTGIAKPAPKPALNLENMPVIKAFMIKEPVGTSSESVNRIYTMYGQIGGEISYVRKLVKEGNNADAQAFIKAHPEIANVTLVNGVVDSFSDINRVREQIMNSKTLTPEQKRQKIQTLDQAQTIIAQRALRTLNATNSR